MKKVIALKEKEENKDFLRIAKEDGAIVSGGNQLWFKDTEDCHGTRRTDFGACGVIAAANVLSYLEQRGYKNMPRCTFLPEGAYREDGAIYQQAYMELAKQIYDEYITPFDVNKLGVLRFGSRRLSAEDGLRLFFRLRALGSKEREAQEVAGRGGKYSLGVWPISRLEKGLFALVYDRGWMLLPSGISNGDLHKKNSLVRACKFISDSLKRDVPVIMLVSHNPSARHVGKSTDRHYMVITAIEMTYEAREDGEHRKMHLTDASITVASWGKESPISLKALWQDSVFAKAGAGAKRIPGMRPVGQWIDQHVNSIYLTSFQ